MKRTSVLLLLSISILQPTIHAQVARTPTNDKEPQAVCSYITTGMISVLSQVPTLCSAVRDEVPEYLNINIFPSGNVLQGPMRRTWTSALFQTLEGVAQDTPLTKACSGDNVCIISFADTQMTQHNWHYELYLTSKDVDELQGMLKANKSAEFSEMWYWLWWNNVDKKSSNPRSIENAALLGDDACKDFSALANKRAQEYGMVAPSCSVQLATSDNIYVVIDFNDFMKALTGTLLADDLLPNSIAKTLSNTGYGGEVAVKSPWLKTSGGNERVYRTYRLKDLEFAYEEEQGGSRSESDVGFLLATRYRSEGVTNQNHLLADPKADSAVRLAAVVSMVQSADGSQLIDTTDGAAWRVSTKSSVDCDLQVGKEIFVFATGDTSILTTRYNRKECKLDASFVMGW
jgi:hypothetical protein